MHIIETSIPLLCSGISTTGPSDGVLIEDQLLWLSYVLLLGPYVMLPLENAQKWLVSRHTASAGYPRLSWVLYFRCICITHREATVLQSAICPIMSLSNDANGMV